MKDNNLNQLSLELLKELENILYEEYGILYTEDELSEISDNILAFYSLNERFSNELL